jgi:hypothetical protein
VEINTANHQETPSTDLGGYLVTRTLAELQPHPSYVRHRLTITASQLSALAEHAALAFREPLIITQDGHIIDGYARWELARHQGRENLQCLKFEVSEAEAIHWILRKHQRSNGFKAFNRILIALDLESAFQGKARSNQRAGGQYKASSNLTEAEKLDVRAEVAAVAGVSVGNVTKVKHLKLAAHAELLEALRTGEVSIHRAWLWSRESPEMQRDALWQYRAERGIRKTIREHISKHRSKKASTIPPNLFDIASRLSALPSNQAGSIRVSILKASGKALYLTEEMASALHTQQPSLCDISNR